MQIEYQTDTGKKRRNNQDYVGVYHNQAKLTLAVLSDGMGGHQAGDVASKTAVQDLGEAWEMTDFSELELTEQWLKEHIQLENQRIFEKGQEQAELYGMGTTIVAVVLTADQFLVAHVGDSRLYLLRNKELTQITDDHSLVNELVKSGEITAEMAENHPQKNILVRSVGMPGDIKIDLTLKDLQVDDYLLICSDGLTNMVSNQAILKIILQATDLKNKVTELIDAANSAGGRDNITALLIHLDDSAKEATE